MVKRLMGKRVILAPDVPPKSGRSIQLNNVRVEAIPQHELTIDPKP